MSIVIRYSDRWISPQPLLLAQAETATAAMTLIRALERSGFAIQEILLGDEHRLFIRDVIDLALEEELDGRGSLQTPLE